MTGYKIYLTKSSEVASLISTAHLEEIGKDNLASTSSGCVHKDCRIPPLYHDKGYFYCILEYRNIDSMRYEIIFA